MLEEIKNVWILKSSLQNEDRKKLDCKSMRLSIGKLTFLFFSLR